jgi:hypothetical protein
MKDIKMTNKAPIVMAVMPKIYTKHIAHFKKAEKLTYNYAPIDDHVVTNYMVDTIKKMAADLNEPRYRIESRIQVLARNKVIVRKTKAFELAKRKTQALLQLEEIEKQLKTALK